MNRSSSATKAVVPLLAVGATLLVGTPAADAKPRCAHVSHSHNSPNHGHVHTWDWIDHFNENGGHYEVFYVRQHNKMHFSGDCNSTDIVLGNALVDPYEEIYV